MSAPANNENNTVLQRLLAEKYRSDEFKSSCSLTGSESSASVASGNPETRLFPGVEQIDTSVAFPLRSDIHTRIDALWRSTLDTPRQGVTSQAQLDGNRYDEASSPRRSNDSRLNSRRQSAARETLARLRKELEEDSMKMSSPFGGRSHPSGENEFSSRHGSNSTHTLETFGSFPVSPRYSSRELPKPVHKPGCHSLPSTDLNSSYSPPLRPELHGHPKSNSGGDEYLYTDQLRRNYQRRGIRSKKNKVVVGRSSSLRHTPNDLSPVPQTPGTNTVSTITERYSNDHGTESTKHRPTRSAPLQNCTSDVISSKLRRSSLHAPLNNLKEVTVTDSTAGESPSFPQKSTAKIELNNSDMHQNHQLLLHNAATGGSGPFNRGGTAPYMQGSYYPATCNPPALKQNTPTSVDGSPSMMSAYGNSSPPRPPPPPYPVNYNDKEPGLVPNLDGDSWNPQRPNSLALGNCSKKKSTSGGVLGLNSPCLTSPTNPNCFTPTVRPSPFYNGPKESPYTNNSAHIPSGLHQLQTNNGSSSYVRQTGSNVATPSSSGSSTVTAATTPAYPDLQSYSDPTVRSPPGGYRYTSVAAPVFSQDHYGSGVNKSDSINSASSGTTSSSGAGRIARKKRNSSSKLGFTSANCSGSSSSNSGSRPNSNADLAERLEMENENLRNRLESALQKLRRYESIELELVKINQSHQALQQTASNRERLEKEMRTQLSAKLNKVEKERDDFENQVKSLTELLKHAALTSQQDNQQEETKINEFVHLYEAKNRKLAERERQLQEELDECRERMSEQKNDIARLATKLQESQNQPTFLQDRRLSSNSIDEHTEELSERLLTLQKIVDERRAIEAELRDRVRQQLQSQRPFKSTSSNDEGISEMDPTESTGSVDLHNSPDGRMLGAKAEMLKWKYRYLEHGLLKHVHSSGTESSHQRSIHRALRNHRHAVSDPGFDKNPLMKYLLPEIGKGKPSPGSSNHLPESCDNLSGQKLKSVSELDFQDGVATYENLPTTQTSKADCACQTPSADWDLGENGRSLANEFRDDNLNKDENSSTAFSAGAVEGDLPTSEGYHSQQSSGSPTPNQEKCAFSGPMGRAALTNSPKTHESQTFRRNKSADDVLTIMKV